MTAALLRKLQKCREHEQEILEEIAEAVKESHYAAFAQAARRVTSHLIGKKKQPIGSATWYLAYCLDGLGSNELDDCDKSKFSKKCFKPHPETPRQRVHHNWRKGMRIIVLNIDRMEIQAQQKPGKGFHDIVEAIIVGCGYVPTYEKNGQLSHIAGRAANESIGFNVGVI